jgi:hypothetical protein
MPGQNSPASSRTRAAYLEHEQARAELKSLMPEDANEAIGHGICAQRSKSGAISFDLQREPSLQDDGLQPQ